MINQESNCYFDIIVFDILIIHFFNYFVFFYSILSLSISSSSVSCLSLSHSPSTFLQSLTHTHYFIHIIHFTMVLKTLVWHTNTSTRLSLDSNFIYLITRCNDQLIGRNFKVRMSSNGHQVEGRGFTPSHLGSF